MTKIKVRYGPSPTGIPHIGNIRTALFNYLLAKNQNGQFFLRIEDTDQARIVKGAVEKIKESLTLLGLNWDGEIIFQSYRLDLYKKYLDELKSKKLAYEDEGAWRFKINTTKAKIGWQDAVHRQVEFPSNVLEDFIITKSDGFPTYHFASVVDDHDMQISHVIRGDEWISSTPKHLLLYEALGWQPPEFVHLPPILGSNHKKLSKRDGAKSIMEYIDEGYLPEALISFMALLGWSPKSNQEIFTLTELTKEFSLDRINKNSPIFNLQKLNWFNSQWIRKLDNNDLANRILKLNPQYNKEKLRDITPLIKERVNNLKDIKIADLFFKTPNPNDLTLSVSGDVMSALIENYQQINNRNWQASNISSATTSLIGQKDLDKKELYKNIGMTISGSNVTPPLFDSIEKLGKDETIERLKNAAKKLKK